VPGHRDSAAGLTRGITRFLDRLRGSTVEHSLRHLRSRIRAIDAQAQDLEREGDRELRARGDALRDRVLSGATVDGVAAEGIALVREVGRRVLGLRLYESQVMAAIGLHDGKVVELATGEGKTLAAVAPAWLSSLNGRGVHLLTFNDYLARRDAAWMGPIYEFLGTRVGCVQEASSREERRNAYACDVTYGTAKQAGFDYLRDGMAFEVGDRVHRPFHHAIVDEADSLMIDEARVPLVLAGGAAPPIVDPRRVVAFARGLERGRDYEIDENARNVSLTDDGITRAERELGIANLLDATQRSLHTAVNLALHAEVLLHRDVDYIVRDGRIEVVDEFTGRVVADRRWPDGLHPALEAKEGLAIGPEGAILASIPLQHFFQLYPRLSGMTATAVSAAEELHAIYGVEVLVIPPHKPCNRRDEPDAAFPDRAAKHRAIVGAVAETHRSGRPVLVGTATVEESETLLSLLQGAGISSRVLNAKNDEEEARIIGEAGRQGAVTISTNMAGRGTDIRLGGSSEERRGHVVALGGLFVVGANRHESSRIDNQLRGRAGRQGDPGGSRFFVSLEDDLIRRYGLEDSMGEIDHAQRVVEGQNADIRRTLWTYTSLVEQQRRILAELREAVLSGGAGSELLERCSPARHAELVRMLGSEATAQLERRVVLVELDRAWSAHLARLADARENIHMHYFAGLDWFGGIWGLRKTPVDVFHEMAVEAFDETRAQLEIAAAATYDALPVDEGGVQLEREELRGPASTWTYIVNDTPFEGTIIRLDRLFARKPRR
jgi:preprotein translocase subunit SecA